MRKVSKEIIPKNMNHSHHIKGILIEKGYQKER